MVNNIKRCYSIFLCIFLNTMLFSCSGSDSDGQSVPDEITYTLTVNNGSGSGEYEAGEVVNIVANTLSDLKKFNVWTDDVDNIASIYTEATTLTMPANNVSITASYLEVPSNNPVTIDINLANTHQIIEGFGFFGAYDYWWRSNMWNEQWGEKVISDLGLSIWRNEYYPVETATSPQDADWEKQKPVVEGLKALSDKYNVDLKFIFSVWSPPEDLKWTADFGYPGEPTAVRGPGDVTTKNGGTLNPNKYTEFADWLIAGIKLYEDSGINLYALSTQNELMFEQTFNSCRYTFDWYEDMLIDVVPKIKAVYPNVKIFGSENMLNLEGANNNYPYFYHASLKKNVAATSNIDILAVHGYRDGVAPSSGTGLVERWTNHYEQFSVPMDKDTWMTETSGYSDTWENSDNRPGGMGLAFDIHAALYYGNVNAWLWWQGSGGDGSSSTIGVFDLMNGMNTGKKYATSKHYYRYIRPGALRVNATTNDDQFFTTSYKNAAKGTQTIILINSSTENRMISLNGTGLSATFEMYRTNAENENCTLIKTIKPGASNAFVMPARTLITLQAGGDEL